MTDGYNYAPSDYGKLKDDNKKLRAALVDVKNGKLKDENKKLRAALVDVKKWIMDPFGPDDFNSKSLHPAFLRALKAVNDAIGGLGQ